ncbi:4-fold beta flower protein [Enterobacter hormaechei]|uniref:4-fold beta flower protein n=1 Tax=Enterobacter cloacae complex TaxID=354276 RepID=UPI000797B8E2|nr:hypothetical protein [Enterobacter hormaechei]ELS4594274.1 hypothetical protein [Enterobacter hormaechei]MBW7766174.1 hypothetical protein [Enterobacter hormaechei]MCW4736616.1 hypothetical protein [Enterobacter hormaechei subsp. xiangfangensis]CZW71775.1 Uncharacterised protein [Enterobacter hormaechei]CZW73484.1 Uncharacterised protein [Enterobacter hormaechei]
MSTNVWTWGGTFFGYIANGKLYTHRGKHVGKIVGEEIFDRNGNYLGEMRNGKRLITNKSKTNKRSSSFSPVNAGSCAKYVNYVGYVMYVGYKDFPSPEEFA